MSTVASGAATRKMISSTSITSMNGVTLISWVSSRSSVPWPSRIAMTLLRRLRQWEFLGLVAVEIAAHQPHHFGRRVGERGAVAGDRTREHVVDHDGRDRRRGGKEGR